jgi:hypothetical protein
MRRFACLTSLIAAISAGGGGCGSKQVQPECASDNQCGALGACMMGRCLPRGSGRTLAVEILPRTDSIAAHTELGSVALGYDPMVVLSADEKVTATGTVTYAEIAPSGPNGGGSLTAFIPSRIAGQDDLQFQADLAAFQFAFSVGKTLLKTPATVTLIPNVQTLSQPPVPFATILDSQMTLPFPRGGDMTVVRAILHDSLDVPVSGYIARAFVGTKVVGNVVTTDDTGLFQVTIAPGSIPPEEGGLVTVELAPADNSADNGPRFVTEKFAAAVGPTNANSTKLRIFHMPAFATPAPLRFAVLAGEKVLESIPAVTMRFRTQISAGTDGLAIYEREARTDGMGQVEVRLIPGTATDPRSYEITLLPPPDSGYAGRCVPQHLVTLVGNDGQPQYSTTFTLDPQFPLHGNILGNDGLPAATVNVTATPVSKGGGCMNAASTALISATTTRSGSYRMLVDPGTYRLDIEPPTGAPLPRLTEDGDQAVSVTADTVHDVVLPAGEVVDGRVTTGDADGMPLASAGIKIFEVLCQGGACVGPSRIPPALRSQTRTDEKGLFRAVLPLP